jgi:hypothetical protein
MGFSANDVVPDVNYPELSATTMLSGASGC